MKNICRRVLFFFVIGFLVSFSSSEAETAMPSSKIKEASPDKRGKMLIIGRVSNNPKKHYPRLVPINNYVTERMKDLGITKGSVLIAKDNGEMIRYLKEGKVDWVTETPFSAFVFSEETGAEIILRRWKKGVPDYYTVFFTRKDSGINSIKDIKGKKIAFNDPGSTSSYFVPLAVLKKAGLEPVELSGPREKPPAGKTGYAFTGGDELNVTAWVHKGLAEVGAFSNLDWESNKDVPYAFRKDLKIIYRTNSFPRAVELVRKGLDPRIKKRLKEILLNAHHDPQAEEALEKYRKTARFDEFKGKTKEKLEEARRLFEFIRQDVKGRTD